VANQQQSWWKENSTQEAPERLLGFSGIVKVMTFSGTLLRQSR